MSGIRERRTLVASSLVVAVSLVVLGGCAIMFFAPLAKDMPLVQALRTIPIVGGAEIEIDGRQPLVTDFPMWGLRTELMYRTERHSWDEVVTFYRDQMPDHGWVLQTENPETISGLPAVCLLYQQDASSIFATVSVVDLGVKLLVDVGTVPYRSRCLPLLAPRPEDTPTPVAPS